MNLDRFNPYRNTDLDLTQADIERLHEAREVTAEQLEDRMLTNEQALAARNAAENKWAQVRFAHIWPTDMPEVKPRAFYHVVAGDYAPGSTVTLQTLFNLGLRVEVVE